MYYYMLAPTLCYEVEFPTPSALNSGMNWWFLLRRVSEFCFLSFTILAFFQQWIMPALNNSNELFLVRILNFFQLTPADWNNADWCHEQSRLSNGRKNLYLYSTCAWGFESYMLTKRGGGGGTDRFFPQVIFWIKAWLIECYSCFPLC